MAAPGTAYDDPVLGRDPQVGHLDDYVRTADDDGGVQYQPGIPTAPSSSPPWRSAGRRGRAQGGSGTPRSRATTCAPTPTSRGSPRRRSWSRGVRGRRPTGVGGGGVLSAGGVVGGGAGTGVGAAGVAGDRVVSVPAQRRVRRAGGGRDDRPRRRRPRAPSSPPPPRPGRPRRCPGRRPAAGPLRLRPRPLRRPLPGARSTLTPTSPGSWSSC